MNTLLTASRILQPIMDAPVWVILLLKITAILLAAWFIHLALKRANPRWRVFLWRVTAIGLIALPAVAWLFPALEIRVEQPLTTKHAAHVFTESQAPLSNRTVNARAPIGFSGNLPDTKAANLLPTSPSEQPEAMGASALTEPQTLVLTPSQSSFVTWPVLLVVWFGGIAVLALRLSIGHYRISWIVRRAKHPPKWICGECLRVAEKIGCRTWVEVLQSADTSSPFLCGLRRPLLLLPAQMCDDSYCRDLPGILAHELTHVRSHDVHWNVGLELISITLWFHPLVWRMRKVHLVACELVSDATSADFIGDATDYCRTLARVAVDACSSLPTAGIAMARTSAIGRRLSALKDRVFHLPLRRRSVLGFGLTALLAVVALGTLQFAIASAPSQTGKDQAAPQSGQQTTTEIPKGPEARITVSEGSSKPSFRPMQIQVVDSDGKPVADAGITVRGMTNLPFGPNRYRTNAEGNATVEAPTGDAKDFQVLVSKNKYVTTGAVWEGDGVSAQIPEKFSFTLEPGIIFGGIVRDEQGKPVAGAEVTVDGLKRRLPSSPRWTSIHDTVKTDAEGKWHVDRMPQDMAGFELVVKINRPDVAAIERFDMKALSIDKLRDQTAVFVLRKGTVLEGIVTDPQGKPALGATVGLFPELSGSDFPRTKVDQSGHYRFAVTESGEYTLAAAAKGHAPDSRRLTVKDQSQTVDLQLRKGEMIRLRVVDKAGKPMPGVAVATVFDNEFRDALMLDYQSAFERDNDRHMSADAEGRWSRLWIPDDTLTLLISKPGYGQVRIKIKPGEPERTVTLEAGGWGVAGRVLDAETKTPLTEFRVVEGDNYSGHVMWRKASVVKDANGQYHAHWDNSGNGHRVVRIEADGHLPSEPRLIPVQGREETFNVALRKGKEIAGRVLGPDGKPVADADVCLASATRLLLLRNSYPALDQNPLIVRTAADGRFAQAPQGEPYILVVLSDKGYARFDGDGGPGDIVLKPWGRVEGTLRVADRPVAKQHVRLVFDDEVISNPRLSVPGTVPVGRYLYYEYQTETNDEGHFSMERVRPGKAKICQYVKLSQDGSGGSTWTDGVTKAVEILPGQKLTVELNAADSSALRQRTINETKLREQRIEATKQDDAASEARIEAALKVLNASPPAAQDARIAADLQILRNYSIGKNEKIWAAAIRELIMIGKPAVPQLIAELDRTERPQTLSALGFALRGIGDPQAVPVLIRAIPACIRA
ncbi:MAG: carboxypeptidase regulatory-like domain-containing protein, partial [Thermoguttaceae bacterium]